MEKGQIQGQAQIQVELGEREAEGIYSNVVFIAHSPSEVILDFARVRAGAAMSRHRSRNPMRPHGGRRPRAPGSRA